MLLCVGVSEESRREKKIAGPVGRQPIDSELEQTDSPVAIHV